MYHDTIQIFLRGGSSSVDFEYMFEYSKKNIRNTLFVKEFKYGELLALFDGLGFNRKYLRFSDWDDNTNKDSIVYCQYNYAENIAVFFNYFSKNLSKLEEITFMYGNIIEMVGDSGFEFHPNNLNSFASVSFSIKYKTPFWTEKETIADIVYKDVITSIKFYKIEEVYQIIDNKYGENRAVIASKVLDNGIFKHDFFDNPEIRLFLRPYKLAKLNEL